MPTLDVLRSTEKFAAHDTTGPPTAEKTSPVVGGQSGQTVRMSPSRPPLSSFEGASRTERMAPLFDDVPPEAIGASKGRPRTPSQEHRLRVAMTNTAAPPVPAETPVAQGIVIEPRAETATAISPEHPESVSKRKAKATSPLLLAAVCAASFGVAVSLATIGYRMVAETHMAAPPSAPQLESTARASSSAATVSNTEPLASAAPVVVASATSASALPQQAPPASSAPTASSRDAETSAQTAAAHSTAPFGTTSGAVPKRSAPEQARPSGKKPSKPAFDLGPGF